MIGFKIAIKLQSNEELQISSFVSGEFFLVRSLKILVFPSPTGYMLWDLSVFLY